MQIRESLRIGISELASHKLRSLLTMLGVIFGVGAVVAVVAIGLGAREEALKQVELLGTNNVRVNRMELSGFELAEARRRAPDGLTLGDAAAVVAIVQEVTHSAGRRDFEERVFHDGESPAAGVSAVEPAYFAILGYRVERGRGFSIIDEESARQVTVLGANLAAVLFPVSDPIGQSIQIGRQRYRVVGVLERRPGEETSGRRKPVNMTAFIPLQAGLLRIAGASSAHDLDEIAFRVTAGSNLPELEGVIERILDRRHKGARDYSILIPELLLAQKQATQRIFSVVLLFIAGLSLLVGGIGIMNIMLATVTQRTREIGIRRAIGATRHDILLQFLIEALLICLIGGFLGLAVGVGLARVAELYAGWSTIINVPAVVIAISVSTLTGLVFGLYPSLQAARLDPIEALRHE